MPEVRDYHFILTIKKHDGTKASKNGTVAVGPNATRQQTLNSLGKQLFPDQMPNICVLFFSLEPNQL
jgi:hypothetical protein